MRKAIRGWAAPAVLAFSLAACGSSPGTSSNGKIVVVAAENEYGSMVSAIGGSRVSVTSLLNNPNTDPHEFEASAATARTVSNARLVIENGIGYDPWLDKLLGASPRSGRIVINVGALLGHTSGANPHVWYDPSGWRKEAHAITAGLIQLDPGHRAYYQSHQAAWMKALQPVYREIEGLRSRTAGHQVIATEPVYGYMLAALGLTSLDYAFQKAIMDGTDPSPRSIAEFQTALRGHRAHMLFYNSQVTDPTTSAMRQLATQQGVPVVGVTETQPPALSFVRWQLDQLSQVQRKWH